MTALSLNPSQFHFPRSFGSESGINWGFIVSLLMHGILAVLLVKAVFPVEEPPLIPVQVITLMEQKAASSHQSPVTSVRRSAVSKPNPITRETQSTQHKVRKPVVSHQPKPMASGQSSVIHKASSKQQTALEGTEHEARNTQHSATYSPATYDASYLRNPAPEYPAAAKRRRMQGTVLLSVTVSPTGDALSVKLKKSSGFAPLDMAAESTVKRWQFVPAKRGETPVTAQVIVPVEFRLAS